MKIFLENTDIYQKPDVSLCCILSFGKENMFWLIFSVATNMKIEMVPMSCQKCLMLLLQTQLDHTEIVRNIQWFICFVL